MRIITAVALAATLVFAYVSTTTRLDRLTDAVQRLTEQIDRLLETKNMPGQLYHSHYSAGNPPILREQTTVRQAGESVADWVDRHNTKVAQLLATYPPV